MSGKTAASCVGCSGCGCSTSTVALLFVLVLLMSCSQISRDQSPPDIQPPQQSARQGAQRPTQRPAQKNAQVTEKPAGLTAETFDQFTRVTGIYGGHNKFVSRAYFEPGVIRIIVNNSFFSKNKQEQLQWVQLMHRAARGSTGIGYIGMVVSDSNGNRIAGTDMLGGVNLR